MFKERSTEKLIEYIQTLPGTEQQLIAQSISQARKAPKVKKKVKQKLSLLKGKVSGTRLTGANFEKFLLSAPTFSEKQLNTIAETRKAINQWRKK